MNSYGISHFWQQGDAISHFVAILLVLMSIVTWVLILYKAIRYWQVRQQAKLVDTEFWHSKNFADGISELSKKTSDDSFRILALDGLRAVEHHAQNRDDLHGALNVSEWLSSCLRRSLDNSSARLQSGLSILASIGSTSPFIGLFGTVWGIYHALISIGQSGQVGIEQISGPVGEALIMTAMGLAVAIPAVLGYNTLLRQQKSIMARLNNFSYDLHAYFITGSRMAGAQEVANGENTNKNNSNNH